MGPDDLGEVVVQVWPVVRDIWKKLYPVQMIMAKMDSNKISSQHIIKIRAWLDEDDFYAISFTGHVNF